MSFRLAGDLLFQGKLSAFHLDFARKRFTEPKHEKNNKPVIYPERGFAARLPVGRMCKSFVAWPQGSQLALNITTTGIL
jgi:hypothetical protein